MSDPSPTTFTSFCGSRRIATGDLRTNALAARRVQDLPDSEPTLTFRDDNGETVELDLRGSPDEVIARIAAPASDPTTTACGAGATASTQAPVATQSPRGRGRPKLGVVPREVTLLPRHWAWLEAQPGGASVTLRKLVEHARREGAERERRRGAQARAYRVMSTLAGNLPGFEEASRALFADDAGRFGEHAAGWPEDVRAYVTRLAFVDAQPAGSER